MLLTIWYRDTNSNRSTSTTHKLFLGYFTPSSLEQKLMAQNKVLTWSSIQTPLKCTSTDICIIDQRCLSK